VVHRQGAEAGERRETKPGGSAAANGQPPAEGNDGVSTPPQAQASAQLGAAVYSWPPTRILRRTGPRASRARRKALLTAVLERVAPALLDTEDDGESDAVALLLGDGVPVPLALALAELLPLLVDVTDGVPPMVRLDVCGRAKSRRGRRVRNAKYSTRLRRRQHVWLQWIAVCGTGSVRHRGARGFRSERAPP